jgi:hypothetical protein
MKRISLIVLALLMAEIFSALAQKNDSQAKEKELNRLAIAYIKSKASNYNKNATPKRIVGLIDRKREITDSLAKKGRGLRDYLAHFNGTKFVETPTMGVEIYYPSKPKPFLLYDIDFSPFGCSLIWIESYEYLN